MAKIDEWELPEATAHHTARPTRREIYVMLSETESDRDESDTDSVPEPYRELYTRQLRGEREDSSSEDDIPLIELKKRSQDRQRKKRVTPSTSDQEKGEQETASDSEGRKCFI